MMAQSHAAVSLQHLFAGIDCPTEIPDVAVTDITSDSRHAQQGGLFLACQGYDRHGLDYIEQVWPDITPLRVRQQLEEIARDKAKEAS